MSFWKKLAKYKKAGMELSINAIVILIIAMIVLGLGIVFIRGLFTRSGEKLTGAIGGVEVGNPASADRPITIDKEITVQKSNPTKVVEVSIYNPTTSTLTNVKPSLDPTKCTGDKATAAFGNNEIKLIAPQQDIPPGKNVGYKAILQIATTTTGDNAAINQGTIICPVVGNENGRSIEGVSTTTSIIVT